MNSVLLPSPFSKIAGILTAWLLVTFCSKAKDTWIGITPDQLVPGSRPLGKMSEKNFDNLQPVTPVSPELNNEETTPVQETGEKSFSDFHSNLGQQTIVEKIGLPSENWIGDTPDQILPSSKPLGSMKNRSELQG